MVSGEQPSDRICRKIEIISFPSLSERGPRGLFIEKGGVRGGEEEWKARTLLMGHFDPLFLSSFRFFVLFRMARSSPGSGSGKGQRKDLISKQSLEFSLIRTGLARK